MKEIDSAGESLKSLKLEKGGQPSGTAGASPSGSSSWSSSSDSGCGVAEADTDFPVLTFFGGGDPLASLYQEEIMSKDRQIDSRRPKDLQKRLFVKERSRWDPNIFYSKISSPTSGEENGPQKGGKRKEAKVVGGTLMVLR